MTDPTNDYAPGSLPWIERNQYIAVRVILNLVLDGTLTHENAAQALHSLDTDTVR